MALTKSEEFAKKIIKMAAEDGLTVGELRYSVTLARDIANNSTVRREAVEGISFPSEHYARPEKDNLFGD